MSNYSPPAPRRASRIRPAAQSLSSQPPDVKLRSRTAPAEPDAVDLARRAVVQSPTLVPKTPLAALADILSPWIVAPLVFLFLIRDTGELKRGLLAAVSNRLFEPALTVMADLDRALGNYVRGIFLECALLGLTVGLFLTIVGVPLRWAIAIGLFAGATNWFRTSASRSQCWAGWAMSSWRRKSIRCCRW